MLRTFAVTEDRLRVMLEAVAERQVTPGEVLHELKREALLSSPLGAPLAKRHDAMQ